MSQEINKTLMEICSVELVGCSANSQSGSDKLDWHSYIPVYEDVLAPIRHSAENVLEIGIHGGGSIVLWERYFSKAKVVGVDITGDGILTSRTKELLGDRSTLLWNTDAYTGGALQTLSTQAPGGFDLIVDDGPHTIESQVYCASQYPSLLKTGGLLIIEDIDGMPNAQRIMNSLPSSVNGRIVDLRSQKGRFDDIMVIAQKHV